MRHGGCVLVGSDGSSEPLCVGLGIGCKLHDMVSIARGEGLQCGPLASTRDQSHSWEDLVQKVVHPMNDFSWSFSSGHLPDVGLDLGRVRIRGDDF